MIGLLLPDFSSLIWRTGELALMVTPRDSPKNGDVNHQRLMATMAMLNYQRIYLKYMCHRQKVVYFPIHGGGYLR